MDKILKKPFNIKKLNEIFELSVKFQTEVLSEFMLNLSKLHPIRMGFGYPEKPHSVEGWEFKKSSIIMHTHLTEEPPSSRDFVTMMMSTIIDECKYHIVIGCKYIFLYKLTKELKNKLKNIITIDNCKNNTIENSNIIKNNINKIIKGSIENKHYFYEDTSEWCYKLKQLGIHIKICDKDLCNI